MSSLGSKPVRETEKIEYQYRRLLSCSRESLQSIKYETVHYSLAVNAAAEEKLSHFLYNVKDKSKQISVTLIDMNEAEIKKYAEIPVLEISANSRCMFPPVFYGKQLTLQSFKLSNWSGLQCALVSLHSLKCRC
jgi:hypothetical protein